MEPHSAARRGCGQCQWGRRGIAMCPSTWSWPAAWLNDTSAQGCRPAGAFRLACPVGTGCRPTGACRLACPVGTGCRPTGRVSACMPRRHGVPTYVSVSACMPRRHRGADLRGARFCRAASHAAVAVQPIRRSALPRRWVGDASSPARRPVQPRSPAAKSPTVADRGPTLWR